MEKIRPLWPCNIDSSFVTGHDDDDDDDDDDDNDDDNGIDDDDDDIDDNDNDVIASITCSLIISY